MRGSDALPAGRASAAAEPPSVRRRGRLSRERVLHAAVEVADELGVGAVTMRSVAERLDVEAMALYRHVRGKDEILDSLVETVVDEINSACADLPREPAGDWVAVARRRILTARTTLLAHPWAPALISSRGSMGAAMLRYFDDFAGVMVRGGCSIDLVHHAMHALGSRVLGFSPELFEPGAPAVSAGGDDPDAALAEFARISREYPYVTRVVEQLAHDATTTLGWCDDQSEFEFGLDIMLEGLERRRQAEPESR